MGLLDDLRRQAEEQKAREKAESVRQQSDQEFYQQQMIPCLMRVYHYFKEISQHLEYVKPEIYASYALTHDGRDICCRQAEYKINLDSSKEPKEATFSFVCNLEQSPSCELSGRDKIKAYSTELDNFNIKYERLDFRSEHGEQARAKFSVAGPVRVVALFRADMEKRQVRLLLRNTDKAGTVQYVFATDQVNTELLDKLAGFLLKQSPHFIRLEITEEHKQFIRKKVERAQQWRAIELAEAKRREAEEAKLQEEENKRRLQLKGLSVLKNITQSIKENLKDLSQVKNFKDNLKNLFSGKKS